MVFSSRLSDILGVSLVLSGEVLPLLDTFSSLAVPSAGIAPANVHVPNRFPPMIENVGLYGSAGIVTALMVTVSIIPTVFSSGRDELSAEKERGTMPHSMSSGGPILGALSARVAV